MKKKEKAYSITLASTFIIFLIFVSSAASAPIGERTHNFITPEITNGAGDPSDDQILLDEVSIEGNATESIQAAAPNITETQITTNESDQWDPDIYGNRVVWTDYRNDNGSYTNSDIYMCDLATKKETQITTDGSNYHFSPAIYGNRIVWEDYRNGNGDIYMYNLSTSKETQITTNGLGSWSPDIYGDKIVWTGYRDRNYSSFEIYMYNISTSKETQITTDGSNYHVSPAIYGNRIVWEDYRNEYADIYMYDFFTKKETRITTNESDQWSPEIYGNRIVWMDDRNGNWDILHVRSLH